MNIQVEAGTRISIIPTVPKDADVNPLIMVFVGPRAVALELGEAADIARKLASAAGGKAKIPLSIDDMVWEMPPETAARIASGISSELSKLGVAG